MIVYHRHMKAAGINYCNSGARRWFEYHNLNWSDFITNGIAAEILIATGDAMALTVVEEARKEWAEAAKVVDRR